MSTTRSPTVFLSYAREDGPEAQRLYDDLTRAGLAVWFDRQSLHPGQQWKPAIQGAIREARFFIALMSSRSVTKRGFVNREISEALDVLEEFPESAVFLIPVRLDDCAPSHSRLTDLERVDLFSNWDAGLRRLLEALGHPDSHLVFSPSFHFALIAPTNGSCVSHSVRFEGIVSRLPPGAEIWVVTEPSRNNFHPNRGPALTDGTRWFATAYIGNRTVGADTGGHFTVHVVLVTHEAGRRFHSYLDQAHVTGGWVGLPSLYGGKILSTVELVRDDEA